MADQTPNAPGVLDAPASETPSGAPEAGILRHTAAPKGGRIATKLGATVGTIAICALLLGAVTWSNLNATATNGSNAFTAGTVQIGTNTSGSALLSLTNAKPGAVSTGCVQVSYAGTLPANVKLYGTTGGTGLAQYLTLVVTRGSFSATPPAASCTGFTADPTSYLGQGAGVIYSGTLAGWPVASASGLTDPTAGAPAVWNANTAHGYQFQVTVQGNNAAQGLTASEAFTFQADNTP
jgi:hypothetical protein